MFGAEDSVCRRASDHEVNNYVIVVSLETGRRRVGFVVCSLLGASFTSLSDR